MCSAISTVRLLIFSKGLLYSTPWPGKEQGGLHVETVMAPACIPFCCAGRSHVTRPSCKAGWEMEMRWASRKRRGDSPCPRPPVLARTPGFGIALGTSVSFESDFILFYFTLFYSILLYFILFFYRSIKNLFLWALPIHAITWELWFLSTSCSTSTLGMAKAGSQGT